MRRAVAAVAAALLLAGPTALAFFSGGYFAEARLVAAIVAWALVLALAVVGPAPLPRSGAGRLALGGLVLVTVWSAVSLVWAPLGGPAIANVQRLVLYVGALVLAVGALRSPRALRAVEPALAAGATVVIAYGLVGRLLPGIVRLAHSRSTGGRLEQPITYWNAEGALAAVGLVLCARLAGDHSRPAALRAAAAAATVPLGAGVLVSFSRGAIVVALLGLVILVAAAASRTQLRAAATALVAGGAGAAAAAVFPGVASLEGSHRVRDGAVVLALLLVLAAAAAVLTARHARAAPAGADTLPGARRLGPIATVVVAAVAAGLIIGGLNEKGGECGLAVGAQASRLTSVSSNRYEYWRVGLLALERHPVAGLGSGGFRVLWLQERTIPEAVKDVHSLEFEMAAELGLVGLALFAAMVAGVAAAARTALSRHRAAAAGPCAAMLVWFLHASIDWDWELPAVSLPAIVLAGALIALAEAGADEPTPVTTQRRRAPSGSSRRSAAVARRAVAGS